MKKIQDSSAIAQEHLIKFVEVIQINIKERNLHVYSKIYHNALKTHQVPYGINELLWWWSVLSECFFSYLERGVLPCPILVHVLSE